MCDPVTMTLVMAGVSAGGAGLSVLGDEQRYASEVEYTNKLQEANKLQMDENRDLATRAYLDQAEAANRALAESREATSASNFDRSREAMKARGEVLTAAAEAGVGGNSLSALLDDFHRQEGMFKQRNEMNLLFKEQQTAQQVKGYRTEALSRVASIKPLVAAPIKKVDYLGPMLKVVGSGLNAGMSTGAIGGAGGASAAGSSSGATSKPTIYGTF